MCNNVGGFLPKPSLTMITLDSSAIEAVDYNEFTCNLTIYFHDSGGYTFYGVPWDIYLGLISADSPGTFYNRYIRGRYA